MEIALSPHYYYSTVTANAIYLLHLLSLVSFISIPQKLIPRGVCLNAMCLQFDRDLRFPTSFHTQYPRHTAAVLYLRAISEPTPDKARASRSNCAISACVHCYQHVCVCVLYRCGGKRKFSPLRHRAHSSIYYTRA